MKRMLGLLLALAVMVGMSMPTFAQEKGKAEAKKGTTATEKKAGDSKKSESDKKADKKATDKKAAKKGEKKTADKK